MKFWTAGYKSGSSWVFDKVPDHNLDLLPGQGSDGDKLAFISVSGTLTLTALSSTSEAFSVCKGGFPYMAPKDRTSLKN